MLNYGVSTGRVSCDLWLVPSDSEAVAVACLNVLIPLMATWPMTSRCCNGTSEVLVILIHHENDG